MAQPVVQDVTANQFMLLLIGGGLFVAVFMLLAVIISMMNYKETPVKDRLLMLKQKDNWDNTPIKKREPFDDLKDAIIAFSGPISKNLYGTNEKYQRQIKSMLTEAGEPDTQEHVWQFLAKRVATGLVVSAVLFVLLLFTGNMSFAALGLIGGFLGGGMIPQMTLAGKAKKRKTEIRYSLPDTLDLMVVCVEAGLGLDACISRVADETERMAPEISHEFKRLNRDLNAGIPRNEAFQNMGQRAGVDELRSLCAMIIQADKMGTSVADTLRVYADDLRVKRKQKAEELASKASIKMTFPLVLFIFPPLFIILMGPIAIKTIFTFMKPG